MRELFRVPEFEPRETSPFFYWFNGLITLPLLAMWGSGGWLVFEFVRGSRGLALLVFPLWLAAIAFASVALHRAGRVRIGVSSATTALLLLAAWFVAGTGR